LLDSHGDAVPGHHQGCVSESAESSSRPTRSA
jgi:hypothetical protein